MTLSAGTQGAVQALWTVGARYGREVSPSAGADLLEDEDPLGPPEATTVELAGVPVVTVRLFRDLRDLVTIDGIIEFEVPRKDTAAVVESVLAGNARLSGASGTRWNTIRATLLAPFVPYVALVGQVVVVTVPGGARYEQPVPYPLGGSVWLSELPST